MNKIAIFGLAMFLSVTGFAQIPSDTTLGIRITSRSKSGISGFVSNTEAGIQYEFRYKEGRTNWLSLCFIDGSEITNLTAFHFGITNLGERNIRVRSWRDSYDIGIPDWWQMRYFGSIGIDAYANPMGDGWDNLHKYWQGMNPFKWYPPAESQIRLTVRESTVSGRADAILTWQCIGLIPNAFIIERANQVLRAPNIHRLPGSPVPFGNPAWARDQLMVTGLYQVIARVPRKPNVLEFRYLDTNINAYPPPAYRVRGLYPEPPEPPSFAKLSNVTAASIRRTILSVTANQTTDGYELAVLHPMIHARYLLLVRDKIDPEWRASGYFVSGTNRNPVRLHADKKGMMTGAQSPITLPPVKFLSDVVHPEFTAGWGEDSDGDGLPDIYEVLVTHTDPDDADTGDTGVPDGFRVFANDGWNNWEKFRYRANPFRKYAPPPAIVLKRPTDSELLQAQTINTDLPYQIQLEIRTNGSAYFQPFSVLLNAQYLNTDRTGHARCDVRVSWKVPPPEP